MACILCNSIIARHLNTHTNSDLTLTFSRASDKQLQWNYKLLAENAKDNLNSAKCWSCAPRLERCQVLVELHNQCNCDINVKITETTRSSVQGGNANYAEAVHYRSYRELSHGHIESEMK